MDYNFIESFSPIQAIYISKSFCEMMNSQSCDCDSIVIRSGDKFFLLNYYSHDDDGYVEWERISSFDANAYPYEVDLGGNIFRFDRVKYAKEGFVEGNQFYYQ